MKEKFYITNKKKLLFVIKSIVCCILDFKPYGHGINLRIMFSNLTRYQILKACQHIQELENKETQSNGFSLYELALHFTEQIHVDGSQWGAIQRLVQTTSSYQAVCKNNPLKIENYPDYDKLTDVNIIKR